MTTNLFCSWCGKELEQSVYPVVHDFFLSYETGTTPDLFGPSLEGYEVEELCDSCAWKLKQALIDLGIKVKEIDV